MKKESVAIAIFVSIFFIGFVFAAEANFKINTNLNSVDINGRFKVETDSSSLSGFDSNDLEASTDYQNYSLLYSAVSSKNLVLDSRPSNQNFEANLVYSVSDSQSGTLTLSWSNYSNPSYPIVLSYYGTDSSRTSLIDSFLVSSRTSYTIAGYSGSDIYFKLNSTYVPSAGGGCSNTNWTLVSQTSCLAGQKNLTEISNCGVYRTRQESCVCIVNTSKNVYGSWGSCQFTPQDPDRGLQSRIVTNNCGEVSSESRDCCNPRIISIEGQCTAFGTQQVTMETIDSLCTSSTSITSRTCNPSCQESWSCQWSACTNGVVSPSNCVDRNSCGSTLNKPNAFSCSVGSEGGAGGGAAIVSANCSLDLQCEQWGDCTVETGFTDLKFVANNLVGKKTRSCYDRNGCLAKPILETDSCSFKIAIESKKKTICGKEYIEIYRSNSDYLLARIRDARDSPERALLVEFILGGKSEEKECESDIVENYAYSAFDKIAIYSDIKNLLEALKL